MATNQPSKTDTMKKIAGIITDNYKIDKFKKHLAEKGFKIIDISTYTQDTSLIRVRYKSSEFKHFSEIIKLINGSASRSN